MTIEPALLKQAAVFFKKKFADAKPRFALILGSGWGEAIAPFEIRQSVPFDEVPGFGASGVKGHAGVVSIADCMGVQTVIFQGRRHFYEGHGWTPVALPFHVLRELGVKAVLLTSAVGGITKDCGPGSVVNIVDHVNLMGVNPLIGVGEDLWGQRFVDLTCAYDIELRKLLRSAAGRTGENLPPAVFGATSGPSYETPAEIKMIGACGVDVVGMSVVPETILARAAGIKVAACSCVANWATGISPTPLSHTEVVATAKAAMPRIQALLKAFFEELAKSPAPG